MVKLRDDMLRKPLGLGFTSEELDAEKDNMLIAAFEDEDMLGCCMLVEEKPDTTDGGESAYLTLEEVEKRHLMRVLKETKGNKVKAAKILGIDRRTLYRMAERFGLDLGPDAEGGEKDAG